MGVVLCGLIRRSFSRITSFRSKGRVDNLRRNRNSIIVAIVSARPIDGKDLQEGDFRDQVVKKNYRDNVRAVVASSPYSCVSIVVYIIGRPFCNVMYIHDFICVLFVFLALFIFIRETCLSGCSFALVSSACVLRSSGVSILCVIFRVDSRVAIGSFSM